MAASGLIGRSTSARFGSHRRESICTSTATTAGRGSPRREELEDLVAAPQVLAGFGGRQDTGDVLAISGGEASYGTRWDAGG